MAKLSIPELLSAVSSYVASNKIAQTSFTASTDNTAKLLDKIGKIFTIDTQFVDPLIAFEGEDLTFGKTIEEWYEDLILPITQDVSGSSALAPNDPTYRPNAYSYTLGKKQIATTIRNNDLQRAVHSAEQYAELIAMKMKRLSDSETLMKYSMKKEILCRLIGYVEACYSNSASTFVYTTTYNEGILVKDNNTPTKWGILVKKYTASTPGITTWAHAVGAGYIVEFDIKSVLAKPVDTSTGEAFVKQVKADLEIAKFASEGHSLNGNTIGAVPDMLLILKKGIMPSIEVDVMAGAFHENRVALPAEVVVVDDFGDYSGNAYAMLIDRRMVRLHNDYREVLPQINAQGGFVNYFQNTEWTAFVSRNTFVKVYYSA